MVILEFVVFSFGVSKKFAEISLVFLGQNGLDLVDLRSDILCLRASKVFGDFVWHWINLGNLRAFVYFIKDYTLDLEFL